MIRPGADVVESEEDTSACIAAAGCRASAGVDERGMQAEGRLETWKSSPSPPAMSGAGAATETVQALGVSTSGPGNERGTVWYRGQGVHREVDSEGLDEKHRAVTERQTTMNRSARSSDK